MRWRIVPERWLGGHVVLTGAEMREADRHTIEDLGVPGAALMECAGRALADVVADVVAVTPRRLRAPVVVVCGTGNNGGDGLVAARLLADRGLAPQLVLVGPRARLTPESARNLAVAERLGLSVCEIAAPDNWSGLSELARGGVLVDALLGTGLSGALRGLAAGAVDWMNAQGAPVVAADLPSGICSETGRVLGSAVRATETVTFGASTLGHWLYPGAEHAGRLWVVDIGIPTAALVRASGRRRVIGDTDLSRAWSVRGATAHKGDLGHVAVVGGTVGRLGAPRMTADAALRAGAGLVTLGVPAPLVEAVSGTLTEAMATPLSWDALSPDGLAQWLRGFDAAVLGPGLESGPSVGAVLHDALSEVEVPLVIDADALNHFAGHCERLAGRGPRVLTPHPGEAARLLGVSTGDVVADRLAAGRALAEQTRSVVVLKGAHSLVFEPDGALGICPDGNPGMATAGSGDVLAGIIGALLARGLSAGDAARAGVVWHARAGDAAASRLTQNALIARELIASLADVERQCFAD